MTLAEAAVLVAYAGILTILAGLGIHRYHLTALFLRSRGSRLAPPTGERDLPTVTVQLPVFNEGEVVVRLIDAVCGLDWPTERLQVQVLDDSDDGSEALSLAAVERHRAAGLDVQWIRRTERVGYKSGALAAGLEQARGGLVAVFDADFLPPRSFLRSTVPSFADPAVGMVQARWDHLNRDLSLLTRTQAVLLDGHFVVEHTARHRTGRFFNFNGTAGVWRRRCIDDAGGWQHDTLTEDLDLSYRAQLAGWSFVYLPDVTAPAELPVTMADFKTQQHRWAKGSIQTARKLLPRLLRADLPLPVKTEAVAHLCANVAYPLMTVLALLVPPSLLVRYRWEGVWAGWMDALAFALATVSVAVFYVTAERALQRDWWSSLAMVPMVMLVGIGMGVNQSRAVAEALGGRVTPFVRTPKTGSVGRQRGARRYLAVRDWTPGLELVLAAYHAWGVGLAVANGYYLALPFQLLFVLGFAYVGFGTLTSWRRPAGAS